MTDKPDERKAVPREPTDEMITAGWQTYYQCPTPRMMGPIWTAMFDAAPVLATAPAEPPKERRLWLDNRAPTEPDVTPTGARGAPQEWCDRRESAAFPPSGEVAALRTLTRMGYTYHGGEYWKPPIGPAPDFDAMDRVAALIERLRESQERIGNMCSEGRPPKMCIPATEDDDDIFISATLGAAIGALARLSAPVPEQNPRGHLPTSIADGSCAPRPHSEAAGSPSLTTVSDGNRDFAGGRETGTSCGCLGPSHRNSCRYWTLPR